MTCIVGLAEKGNVYMGGDSAGVSGLSVTVRADEKVFFNGPFIIGFTSSFRMGQILRYKFDPPKQTVNQDTMSYLVNDFVDALRTAFVYGGYGKIPDKDDNRGGTFLLGYQGVLYTIDADFQVGIPAIQYDSVGCGQDLAMGALYATKGKKPEDRVRIALEAAASFNAGVSAPFTLLKLTPPKPLVQKSVKK